MKQEKKRQRNEVAATNNTTLRNDQTTIHIENYQQNAVEVDHSRQDQDLSHNELIYYEFERDQILKAPPKIEEEVKRDDNLLQIKNYSSII